MWAAGAVVGEPKHVLDDHLVREADAEGEAVAGGGGGGERLLGKCGRVARIGWRDGGAQANPRHLAPDDGKGGDGIEREDVGHPERMQAGRLHLAGAFDDAVDRSAESVRTYHHTDSHCPDSPRE